MVVNDPIEQLRRLQVSLVTGQLPPDVATWLRDGVEQYLQGGTLEASLGLKARQGKSNEHPRNRLRFEVRDEFVRRLVRRLDGSTWSKAGQLVDSIKDYQKLKASGMNWRDHRNSHLIPTSLSGGRLTYLAEADRINLEIPASQSQLHRILNGRRD